MNNGTDANLDAYKQQARAALDILEPVSVEPPDIAGYDDSINALTIAHIDGLTETLEALSLEVIEPCEPECDEVRHALHQGSWNAHVKIEAELATLRRAREELSHAKNHD